MNETGNKQFIERMSSDWINTKRKEFHNISHTE
jgi:hypothetical protein